MGRDVAPENVDGLGYPRTCGHLEEREKFGDIPLEFPLDMAVCKECYIRLTPALIVADMDIDVPDDVEPGELVKLPSGETADNSETQEGGMD